MNDIKREFDVISQKIQEWQGKLKLLQEKCPHEIVDKEYGSCGEYYSDLVHWIFIRCRDCGFTDHIRNTSPEKYRYWCNK